MFVYTHIESLFVTYFVYMYIHTYIYHLIKFVNKIKFDRIAQHICTVLLVQETAVSVTWDRSRIKSNLFHFFA